MLIRPSSNKRLSASAPLRLEPKPLRSDQPFAGASARWTDGLCPLLTIAVVCKGHGEWQESPRFCLSSAVYTTPDPTAAFGRTVLVPV
jgi:hypothetical protein